MKTKLTLVAGLSEESKKQVQLQYNSSKELLNQFRKLIREEIESSYKDEEDDMNSYTNFDMAVANAFGYRRGLRKILNYLPEE